MRKYAPLLAAAGLVLAGAGCTGTTDTNVNVTTPPPPAAQGRAVFTVTDAAADMTGVSSIMLTVDKLEAHDATEGWVTVSTTPKTYDLIKLKATDSAELLADAKLAAGTYDQIRLDISKVELTVNGKTQTAKLPSSSLKLVGNLTVTAGETTTVALDFMADKSLHLTGSGTYILTPVVRLLIKNAAGVKIDSDEKVEVKDGATETDETEGMDEKGEVKAGFELKDDLDIDADGLIHLRQD